jgi:hypothetical protein
VPFNHEPDEHVDHSLLAGPLTADHGHLLPPGIIELSVDALVASPVAEQDRVVEQLVPAEVACPADVVRRPRH